MTANARKPQVTPGERELFMGELGIFPRAHAVTAFARQRKIAFEVTRSFLIVARMTGNALRGDAVESAGDVALLAGRGPMPTDQREEVMVDGDVTPVPSAVATLAVLREVAVNVRRCADEIRLVTKNTVGR